MATTTFDAHERTPHWVLGRKSLPDHESWALDGTVATGDLGRECKELGPHARRFVPVYESRVTVGWTGA